MENCSEVMYRQIWKHKHSNEKIRVISHICQNIWQCEYLLSKNTTQITDNELLGNWKLLKHENKYKPILHNK